MSVFSGTAEPRAARSTPGTASLPLYLSGLVVLLCGIMTVCYEIDSDTFTTFTVLTTILGVITSFLLRRWGAPPRWIPIGALALGVVFLYTLRRDGIFSQVVPPEALTGTDTLFASALALTAAFSAFVLLSDEAVLFTGVFSVAMIGLIGTSNVNNELLACFLVFLAAIVFLLIHQNALQQARRAEGGAPPTPVRLLRTQVFLALVCTGTAVLVGLLLSYPVRFALRGLALTGALRALRVPAGMGMAGALPAPGTLSFDDPWRFDVGLGPVNDDQTLLMTVELVNGGEPLYWRGRTFSVYNGRGWDSGWGMRSRRRLMGRTLEGGAVFGGYTERVFGVATRVFQLAYDQTMDEASLPRAKTRRYIHRFRLVNGDTTPLFAAAEARVVRVRANSLYHRPDNTFGVPQDFPSAVEEYEVESDVSEATPRDLMRSGTAYSPDLVERYGRSSRNGRSQRNLTEYNPVLAELALEAAQGARDPYSKADAIRRWVAERCVYTLNAPPVPRDQDAAEYFLTVSKTGYCDLYACAVAVLCRYAGLPSRVATGFIPGRPVDNSSDVYELRGADRHAWAEVYFAGYGWVPFDATVGTTVLDAETQQQNGAFSLLASLRRFWEEQPMALILGGLGLLVVLFVLVREAWDRWGSRGVRAVDPARWGGAVAGAYLAAVRAVARRGGVTRPPSMTPAAYVRAVRSQLGDAAADPLARLTALAEQALYGSQTVTPEHVRAANEALRDVRAALKRARARGRGEGRHGRQAAAPG